MTAVALADQPFLLGPDRIQLPRYPQADNDEYLLFSVRAAEESWFSSRFKLPEHRGPQLLQCFGVYAMVIVFYAKESAKFELTWALEDYRFGLAEHSYKFDSLCNYNYAFMNARRHEGQENPVAWRTEDPRCSMLLRLKASPHEAPKPSASKSATPGYGVCRNFNQGRCTRAHCKYSHICLNCQQNHPANACQRPQTTASAANTTPLGNRVSRPE